MLNRFLTSQEEEFRLRRSALIDETDKNFIADSPGLFLDRPRAQSMITRYEMYKKILEVPGDVIELGIYKGNSFSWIANLSVILEPYSINRRFIGFDTFEGFSSINNDIDVEMAAGANVTTGDFRDTNLDTINAALFNIDIVRPVNKIRRFELVKGDIVDTLPAYLSAHSWMTCAMLILDADLYKPTKVGLECVLPIMPKGGLILFDEFNYEKFPGETLALKETLKINGLSLRKMPYESCSAYAIIE